MRILLLTLLVLFVCSACGIAIDPLPSPVPPQVLDSPGDDWRQIARDRILFLESEIAGARNMIALLELVLELDPNYPDADGIRQQIAALLDDIAEWSAEIDYLLAMLGQ